RQAPTPQLIVGSPSSVCPLQLSSIPLQVSVPAGPGVQVCGAPPWQLLTVRTQAPIPQDVCPRPSSVCPLQLSSVPLQLSATGVTWPVQEPHAPPAHSCVPLLQGPTPWVPGGPP